jgi:mycothiol synthase
MTDDVWTIRNFQPGDFEDFLRLHRESERLDRTGHRLSESLLKEALLYPGFQPENDLLLVQGARHVIGYTRVFLEPGIGRALVNGLVHPQHRRKGIATALFGRAVRHAQAAGVGRVQISIAENNSGARQLCTQLGLKFIRYFYGYRLNLPAAQLPQIRTRETIFRSLQPGEENQLTDIQNRAFSGTWGFNPNSQEEIAYRIHSSTCSPQDVIMVYWQNRPIAYCWTRIFQEAGEAEGVSRGEIHMLGVDPDFRQQSIGKNVLLAGLSHLEGKGVELVELTADSEMPAALALYESVGFEKYTKIEWYEKKLI